MKLFRGDTVAKLKMANEDLSATLAVVQELEADRKAKLLDADSKEIDEIDRAITDRNRVANIFRERIAELQSRLADEQQDKDRQDYESGVAAVEKAIGKLLAPAQELSAAIASVAAALERLDAAQTAFLGSYPAGVRLPFESQVGLSRAVRAIDTAFASFAKRGDDRLQHIRLVAADFIAAERDGYTDLIDDLKSQPTAEPESENEVAA